MLGVGESAGKFDTILLSHAIDRSMLFDVLFCECGGTEYGMSDNAKTASGWHCKAYWRQVEGDICNFLERSRNKGK